MRDRASTATSTKTPTRPPFNDSMHRSRLSLTTSRDEVSCASLDPESQAEVQEAAKILAHATLETASVDVPAGAASNSGPMTLSVGSCGAHFVEA